MFDDIDLEDLISEENLRWLMEILRWLIPLLWRARKRSPKSRRPLFG